MKLKLIRTLTVAGVSLVFVQGASAASMVIAAFYDFKLSTAPENYPTPNYFAPGLSGGVTKENNKSSWDDGGSSDGTLGNYVGFADGKFENPPLLPKPGDGHLRIGQVPFPGMPAAHTAGPSVIRVTNSSGMPYVMEELQYDAVADLPGQEVLISYSWTGLDDFLPLSSSGTPIDKLASGAYGDYGDYTEILALTSINKTTLLGGESIYFKFAASSSNTIRLDNIGLVGIPEPGSLLVFGSMAGAALAFRRRQRTA